jgi:archaellum biogenesis ATPase FlaH
MNIVSGSTSEQLVPTGIEGLDYILHGGLPANHLYLVEGIRARARRRSGFSSS